jgi:hypothetical protein
MHDHIYEHQRAALEDNHLEKYASELELDLTLFNYDMSSHCPQCNEVVSLANPSGNRGSSILNP